MPSCLNCGKEVVLRYKSEEKKYCSHTCHKEHFSKTQLELNKELIVEGKITNRPTLYNVLLHMFGNKCQECGIDSWNGKDIKCQVDHTDGDSTNNKLENLRLLCPNCHSQTETFAGRNKGKNVGRWTLNNLSKYR